MPAWARYHCRLVLRLTRLPPSMLINADRYRYTLVRNTVKCESIKINSDQIFQKIIYMYKDRCQSMPDQDMTIEVYHVIDQHSGINNVLG